MIDIDQPSHFILMIPSGKHTKNYGKSPFLMGKLTIKWAIFHSYVKLPEGIPCYIHDIPIKGVIGFPCKVRHPNDS